MIGRGNSLRVTVGGFIRSFYLATMILMLGQILENEMAVCSYVFGIYSG